MKNIRQIHLFLGTFFAPMIIFFAFSGTLQLFGLHESRGKNDAKPIAWIAALAAIHKNQHLRAETQRHEQERHVHDDHDAVAHVHPEAPKTAVPSWGLKGFVLLMAIGLMVTSLIGIYIAIQNPRSRRNAWISLTLGTALPLLLLFL